jgi:K+-transporting ATPase KdpF subunit
MSVGDIICLVLAAGLFCLFVYALIHPERF